MKNYRRDLAWVMEASHKRRRTTLYLKYKVMMDNWILYNVYLSQYNNNTTNVNLNFFMHLSPWPLLYVIKLVLRIGIKHYDTPFLLLVITLHSIPSRYKYCQILFL